MSPSTDDGFDAPSGRASHAAAFVPGTMLGGRYRIVASVGRGGMGEVFRADDLRLGQPVALKFLPPALEQDEEARHRLLAEVRLARTIAHPNVCRVYDVGDLPAEGNEPARSFITMEYIDGEDLGTLLRRIGRLPPDKAVDVARQLCAALAAAHEKGVLHRDLKPANVMIDGRGHVRIADFGIAVEVSADPASVDNAGTAAYMAPERFYGEPASAQSDLYALGLILYEVVTGTAALKVSSPLEWPSAHAVSAPSDPSAIVTDTDPALVQVIMRCLEKDPVNRPSSAAQVAAALPGGDPLAAAVAAGETPSPELVAASGEEGTLPRGKAVAWFATAVATLGLAVWSLSSVLLINHTPMPFDTGTLERQTREMMVSFGYTTPPADWRSFWRRDTRREPHMVRLTYRQSPGSLFETLQNLPWPHFPEDARVYLDSRGRLIGLDIGGDRDYSDTTGARPTNWAPMLAALGSDTPPVPSTPGRWPPAFYADTRAAWTATIDGVPHDVEAASLRGRPVSLRLKPVDAPDERPAPQRGARAMASAVTTFTLLLVVAMLVTLARRNIRLGRGDRPGATRLALAVGLTLVIGLAVTRHWNFENPDLLAQGIVYTVQLPLLLGVVVWLGYIGVEPYVRRRWPSLLVGWARLLDGRIRDGLVGQALLAGVTVGALLTITRAGASMVRGKLTTGTPYLYRDGWQFEASPLFAFSGSIVVALLLVGLLVLARLIVRRDWAAWWVLGLFVVISGTLGGGNAADLVRNTVSIWAFLPVAVVSAVLVMGVFRRFGLLALAIVLSVNSMLLDAPLTLDPTDWYFWRGVWVMVIVLALAAWGFANVLGKQSLIPVEALDS